jgi:hypothetical protein
MSARRRRYCSRYRRDPACFLFEIWPSCPLRCRRPKLPQLLRSVDQDAKAIADPQSAQQGKVLSGPTEAKNIPHARNTSTPPGPVPACCKISDPGPANPQHLVRTPFGQTAVPDIKDRNKRCQQGGKRWLPYIYIEKSLTREYNVCLDYVCQRLNHWSGYGDMVRPFGRTSCVMQRLFVRKIRAPISG